ncbi:hypothetical protein HanRHA438_Chr07g0294631 [Helianthus annuus]|uniref:Uncharacterized protein n=2 Tax=Helianthus annuus TaxID=4232 RepID=A0A9K3IJW4_HELAN|nr:hypothetical protein HanXRQr2_Chr07g0284121 [Helianthus annuus]KAJ0555785.1 hypothetical protein HanIR_Chr07g0306121 [Helianthus annuus]KAJ0903869.1 hypothetical protein HanPSC8_Chr07g0275031 [Helianthus annuus]KAJ0907079.1 hypothetical protein HanRHA438_Chr07g0294631 [Helianthus annuus]
MGVCWFGLMSLLVLFATPPHPLPTTPFPSFSPLYLSSLSPFSSHHFHTHSLCELHSLEED